MLARSLIFAFVIEVVVISLLLHWGGGMAMGNAVVVATAVIVMVRLIIGWLSFLLAWIFRSQPAAGFNLALSQVVFVIARESAAMIRLFFGLHPFAPWLDRPDPDPPTKDNLPVLLVHGFFSNSGFWWDIKRWLGQRGVSNLFTVDLEPMFGDLDKMARQLDRRIRDVLVRSDAEQLVLVAHSMGGLVCRAYLAQHGGSRVRRLITLGSPHNGTILAWLLPGANLAQMRPGNRWLTRLNDSQRGGVPASAVSIFSYHDNIVVPQDSSQLISATNIPVAGVGHLEMAFSPRIKELVLRQIETARVEY